jgi:squalene synthase HpnC
VEVSVAEQAPAAVAYQPGQDGDVAGAASLLHRAATENFKVASRLLPGQARRRLLAIYGYARLVDEIGDSYPGDRLQALGHLETKLTCALQHGLHEADVIHPLVAAAADLVRSFDLDSRPLFDLIEANRLDQTRHRYPTFNDLLTYCSLSANPVGRLVLAAFDALTAENVRCSDLVCTALQIVEHLQDVAEDARSGRIYIPIEDIERFGVDTSELEQAPPAGHRLRALVAFEAARARRLLDEGSPIAKAVTGPLKLAVAGFVAGGYAALDALARYDFDPLGGQARPSRAYRLVRTCILLTYR